METKKWTKNAKFYKKMRDSKLKELQKINLFINGSLVQMARVCGNKNCKCAKGKKHKSYYLTRSIAGKTKTVYVTREAEKDIKLWIKEQKRIKKIMNEISELQYVIIKKTADEKKAQRENKQS